MLPAALSERSERHRMIDRVRLIDPSFAGSMEEYDWNSTVESVPFWKTTRLRTVFVRTSFRTLTRRYADDGPALLSIARPQAIYAINAAEKVELDGAMLPAYVRFFVAHAGVGRGIRIVEDEAEAGFVDDKWLSPEAQARKKTAVRAVRPIRVDGQVVIATAIRALDLVEVAIKVAPSGIVEALTTVVIVEDVPVVA